MKKTNQTYLTAIIIVIIIIGIVVFYNPASEETIKIGAILSLTGDVAITGVSIQEGIEIAVEEINKVGGINGKKLEIIYENDIYENEKTITATQKLINMDKIDIGIISFVHGAKVAMPIFEQNKIPLIVAWDSTDELESGDYIFSTGFSTEKAGEKMAEYAYNKLNRRQIATVLHQDEWSEVIAPAFKKRFQQLGGQVIMEEKVVVGESDFKTIISKIKSKNVDGVYLPLVPFNTDIFLKQAKELGINVPIMSGDAMIPDIIEAAGEAAEGVYFTNIYVEDNEIAGDLNKKYIEKYDKEPPALPMVAFGYDAMLTIKKAIELSEEPTSQGIKDALYQVEIMGAGGEIKINSDGLSERIEKIFQVQDGEAILVE